jgi:hypothetical protein
MLADQMRPSERDDDIADIEPLWAVRANAKLYAFRWPNIVLSGISCSWLFYAVSGGLTTDLVGLAGFAAVSYLILYFVHYYLPGRHYIYFGSRHGISTCYCKQVDQNIFVVKHSMESYDYAIITSVKILELASGVAISLGQAYPGFRESLSSVFKNVPSSPLAIERNPYRGLVFQLDETGVWINMSHTPSEDTYIDKDVVRDFISKKIKRTRYVPILFLNDTIFCYKEHVEMIVGRILSSDRSVELQSAGPAPSQ